MKILDYLGHLLIIIGGMTIVFALYVPVSFEFEGEDQVYFSCIIAGSFLLFLGSAGKVKEIYTQSILLALGSAQFILLIIDSMDVFLFDQFIGSEKYFLVVLTVFFIALLIILMARIWLRRILTLLKL